MIYIDKQQKTELLKKHIEQLANVKIEEIDREKVTKSEDIHIDTSLPPAQRCAQLLMQCNNPYIRRYGDYIVVNRFSREGKTMQKCLESIGRRMVDNSNEGQDE